MVANTFFRNLLDVPKMTPIIKSVDCQDQLPIVFGERGGKRRIPIYSCLFKSQHYRTEYVKGNLKIIVGVQFYIRIAALFRQYHKKDHEKLEQFLKFFFLEKADRDNPIESFDKFLTEEMKNVIFTDYAEQTVL